MSSVALTTERARYKPGAKIALAWAAAVRIVLGIAAIPLAPFLLRDHFVALVLMRPTKEVFLAGGFFVRQGEVSLWAVALAAMPLCIGGVWLFFFLGRAYAREIASGELPGIAARVLTPERIRKLQEVLDEKGPKLIFLGRLAILSSAAVAAAAGAAGMDPRRFLAVDLAGGLLSIAYTVAAGYVLGEAYESAGPWLTVLGVVALLGFAYLLGRSLKKGGSSR